MKLTTALPTLAILGAVSDTVAFAPQHNVNKGSSSSLSMATSMPDSSEWKGYYTTLEQRNEQMTSDQAMLGAEMDTVFDPFDFTKTQSGLFFMRESEIKHGRLAMLAAAGWPLAELWDRTLANAIGSSPVIDATDRNPNVLNGGLDKVNGWYWAAILSAATFIDLYQINRANSDDPEYFPGNLDFDPLGLYPKEKTAQLEMQAKEIRNGRLAMIAVSGFVAQEFVQGNGIVDHSAIFFKPFFM
ncbi:MAG: hypothetical protein SGILL_004096 [Bacillariaceae sp.]